MLKRPHYILFSIVLVVVLAFLTLPKKTAAQLKFVFSGMFLPLVGLTTSVEHLADEISRAVGSRRSLQKEVETLRRENEQLRLRTFQTQQVWEENGQLRQSLEWQKQSPWKPKLARVVLRDPANWWRTLQIDKGSRDGVQPNLPVLTPAGLIGCVREVTSSRSQVALIGDPNCQVSALVKASDANGIVAAGPSSILEQAIVNLKFLPRGSRIKPGDEIITSGLGGIYPKGIPIGHVLDTNTVGYGLYLEARIKLLADPKQLEEVFVLLP